MSTEPQPDGRTAPLRLVVVGGGFTGATLVIHAVRASARPLDIVVIEPSSELGRGIAYGTRDAAHRVNVPTDRMGLSAGDPAEATRWLFDQGVLPDHASEDGDGGFYVARSDYGSFVGSVLRRALAAARGRVAFIHRRASAIAVDRRGGGWRVAMSDGDVIAADMVALCFGHAAPAAPCPIASDIRAESKFVGDPWAVDALAHIGPTDAVLVVGTGLTMADVVVNLAESERRGSVTAISRRGLLPRTHGPFRNDLDILQGEPAPATAIGLLQLVRRRIREFGPDNGWQPVVDSLRAILPIAWNALPPCEQRRVTRRLLAFWDVHRFRIAPQVGAALDRGLRSGALIVKRAGLVGLTRRDGRFLAELRRPDGETERPSFDAVVLCTGPQKDIRANPLVAALLADGVVRLDAVAAGLAVDRRSRLLDRESRAWPNLLAFGPTTRGSFGEMTGAPDIAAHIERLAGALFDAAPAPPSMPARMSIKVNA